MSSKIQRLVEYAIHSIHHKHPITNDICKGLQTLCSNILPEDVGLHVPSSSKKASSSCIEYQQIYENAHVTIGLFILPPYTQIPLHDHPDMTVISHLLYGQLHIDSYDWLNIPKENNEVTATSSELLTAPHTMILKPSFGNIHAFSTTEMGCAILDILTPSYAPEENRPCTYYRLLHPNDKSSHIQCIPSSPPSSFYTNTVPYLGPNMK